MDVLSIESCVRSVVKAYHDAAGLIKRLKQKREGTDDALPDELTKEFEDSLALGPHMVQGQYDHDFKRFGETYARGDAVAREQMKDVLITLQQAVLSNLREVWMDDAALDYKALLNASDDSRVNAVVCLGQLYQRMSAATTAQTHIRMPMLTAGSVITSASPSLQHSNSRSTHSSFSEHQPTTPGSGAENFLHMSSGSSASGASHSERKMSGGSPGSIPRGVYSPRRSQLKEGMEPPGIFSRNDSIPEDNVPVSRARAAEGNDRFSPSGFLLSEQPSMATLVSAATDEHNRSSYLGQDLQVSRPASRAMSDNPGAPQMRKDEVISEIGDFGESVDNIESAVTDRPSNFTLRHTSRPLPSSASDTSYANSLRRTMSPEYSTLEHISYLEAYSRPPKAEGSLIDQQQQRQQLQLQHQHQRAQRQQQQRWAAQQEWQQRKQDEELRQWQHSQPKTPTQPKASMDLPRQSLYQPPSQPPKPSMDLPRQQSDQSIGPEPQQPQYQNEHHQRYQVQLHKYRQHFEDWQEQEVRQPIFKSQLRAQSMSQAPTKSSSFSTSAFRKALPSGFADRLKHSQSTSAAQVSPEFRPDLRTFMTSPSLSPRPMDFINPTPRSRSGSIASTGTTVSHRPSQAGPQFRFETLPMPPVIPLTLPTEMNLAGFCKGAYRLQAGVNKKRAFNLEQRPSGLYNTIDIWRCSKCSFEGPAITTTAPLFTGGRWGGKAEKTFDGKVRSSEGGIKYRWAFLAKCHVPTKTIETGGYKDGSFGAFGCIFCCAEGPGRGWGLGPASAGIAEKSVPGGETALSTPMFGNVHSFMQHLEMHCCVEGMPGLAMQTMSKCIAGRVAEMNEEFDINLPLIGEP